MAQISSHFFHKERMGRDRGKASRCRSSIEGRPEPFHYPCNRVKKDVLMGLLGVLWITSYSFRRGNRGNQDSQAHYLIDRSDRCSGHSCSSFLVRYMSGPAFASGPWCTFHDGRNRSSRFHKPFRSMRAKRRRRPRRAGLGSGCRPRRRRRSFLLSFCSLPPGAARPAAFSSQR